MIIYGFHAVQALFDSGAKVQSVHLQEREGGERNKELIAKARERRVDVRNYPAREKGSFEREFKRLGGTDAELPSSQGVFAQVPDPQYSDLEELLQTLESEKFPIILFLDELTDPQNLGSILRSAAAFNVKAVVVTEHRSSPLTATAARISSGGFVFVPVCRVTNLAQSLELVKEKGFWVIGTSEHAKESFDSARLDGPLAIVIGNEEKGMRSLTEKNCDWLLRLPTNGPLQSLNAGVATAVALALVRQSQLKL